MPTKRVIKQKQKQKQSVVVNVNLAKARARSSAKKSRAKGGGVGRGSVMMLPPPIYASPIDKLTPSIYGSQGQQIQQRSMEDLLKNFLSNQEKQTASLSTPNKLGSAPASQSISRNSSESGTASVNSLRYFPNQHSDSSLGSFSSDSLNPKTASTSIYSRIPSSSESFIFSDDVSELTDPTYMSEYSSDIPTPFQNEERSYLRTAEPDYEINEPKSFSQNEARVSQKNIYESSRRPDNRQPVKIIDDDNSTIDSSVDSFVDNKKRRPPPIYDNSTIDSSVDNSNPFPERMYNKMMGFS